jgi:flagellar protein FliS
LEASILSAPREDLILRTYDALILAARTGLEKMRANRADVQGVHNELRRAQSALAVLMGSLNMEIGGDLARNLLTVYEFWYHQMVIANLKRDPAPIERILPDFVEYRKTWAEAIRRYRAEQPSALTPAALKKVKESLAGSG